MTATPSGRSGLGLGTKLVLFSLVLLAVPFLGYRYVQEMKSFLLRGQEQAQRLAAQAAATALHDRDELFDPATGLPGPLQAQTAFYAYPLDTDLQIDGYLSEWGGLLERAVHHGEAHTLYRAPDSPGSLGFDLVLGVSDGHLVAALRVDDDRIVYRHPGYRRLDNSDHLRLSLVDPGGRLRRYLLTTQGPGTLSAYEVDADWRYPLTGRPEYALHGEWQERAGGYDVELRLPLDRLGPERRMRLAVADVDDPEARRVETVIGTLPAAWSDELNHLLVRSRALEDRLRGLGHIDGRLWVVDRYRRVRAALGAAAGDTRDTLDDALIGSALAGEPSLSHSGRDDALFGDGRRIVVSQPVYSGEEVIGAVVLERDAADILALQRETFARIGLATLGVLLASLAGLGLFAARLAWRIRRLNREAGAAIDDQGRVLRSELPGTRAGDELGELARGVSALLGRLRRYTAFLEAMPRTLRHEINNPLNVISTSLQNLADARPGLAGDRYLDSAGRGVQRLGRIVEGLTEAASLEQALRDEARAEFDLAALLHGYTGHFAERHPEFRVGYRGPESGVRLYGSDLRIEQLLDKLLDNAADFTPAGGAIDIALDAGEDDLRIAVSNQGPPLPAALRGARFDGLVSIREGREDGRPHLGLGLFVARTIAEAHGGRLEAGERGDGRGASLTVVLPRRGAG